MNFFDLPEQINLDVLPEFNLSKIQIGARWFIGQIDKNNLCLGIQVLLEAKRKPSKKPKVKEVPGLSGNFG